MPAAFCCLVPEPSTGSGREWISFAGLAAMRGAVPLDADVLTADAIRPTEAEKYDMGSFQF
jgi:hypothetical protein